VTINSWPDRRDTPLDGNVGKLAKDRWIRRVVRLNGRRSRGVVTTRRRATAFSRVDNTAQSTDPVRPIPSHRNSFKSHRVPQVRAGPVDRGCRRGVGQKAGLRYGTRHHATELPGDFGSSTRGFLIAVRAAIPTLWCTMPQAPAPAPPPSVSIRQAMIRLRLPERQVWRLLAVGSLRPIVETGRAIKIDAASLMAYERSLSRSAPAASEAASQGVER
jgi:hypothetical protein